MQLNVPQYWQANVVAVAFRRAENSGKRRRHWISLWLGLEMLSIGFLPHKDYPQPIEANWLRHCSVCVFSVCVCLEMERQGGEKSHLECVELAWMKPEYLSGFKRTPKKRQLTVLAWNAVRPHQARLWKRFRFLVVEDAAASPSNMSRVVTKGILPFWPEGSHDSFVEFGWLRNENTWSPTLNWWVSGVLTVLEMWKDSISLPLPTSSTTFLSYTGCIWSTEPPFQIDASCCHQTMVRAVWCCYSNCTRMPLRGILREYTQADQHGNHRPVVELQQL